MFSLLTQLQKGNSYNNITGYVFFPGHQIWRQWKLDWQGLDLDWSLFIFLIFSLHTLPRHKEMFCY